MVKVKGPCFSIEAQGTLAKTLIFQRSLNKRIVKKYGFNFHVTGYWQNLAQQQFGYVHQLWRSLHDITVALWRSNYNYKRLRGYHYFFKQNLFRIWNMGYLVQLPAIHGFCVVGEFYTNYLVTGGILRSPFLDPAGIYDQNPYPTPTITITAPNGGEVVSFDDLLSVTWTSEDLPQSVNIYISYDNGSTWLFLDGNLPNTGNASIDLPSTAGANCLIKIQSFNWSCLDISDAVFTIYDPADYPITDQLISWWRFDESAGPTAVDSWSSNDFDVYNASFIAGQINNCVYCDGTDNYLLNTNETAFDFDYDTPFSIECWLNLPEGDSGNQRIFHKQVSGAPSNGYAVFTGDLAGGQANLGLAMIHEYGVGNKWFIAYANYNFRIHYGEWHHIVVTYDGSGLLTGVKFYIDSVYHGPVQFGASNTCNETTVNDLDIIVGGLYGGGYYLGKFDEMKIYNKVLNQSEIDYNFALS